LILIYGMMINIDWCWIPPGSWPFKSPLSCERWGECCERAAKDCRGSPWKWAKKYGKIIGDIFWDHRGYHGVIIYIYLIYIIIYVDYLDL
jgi:hypothetical protein